MDKLKFGTAIEFSGKCYFVKNPIPGSVDFQRSICTCDFTKNQKGIIIGKTQMKAGIIDYNGECGNKFYVKKTVAVYQVKTGFYNKIIDILPEQIIKVLDNFELSGMAITPHVDFWKPAKKII